MVKSLLLWVVLVLCSLVTLAWGFLSMFSPRALARVMVWWNRADKWSTRRPSALVSGSLQQRVAGFFAALMGGWMLFTFVHHGLYGFHLSAAAPIRPGQSGTMVHPWLGWVMGLLINGLGLALLLRPELNVRMVQKNLPDRELSPHMVKQTLQGGRFLGTTLIIFGMWFLFHLCRSTR